MQAAPVADLADLLDDLIDRGQRPARDEAADENRQGKPGHEDQEQRGKQLLRSELGGGDVCPGEERADLGPGVAQRQHDVVQRRAVGVDAHGAGGPPGPGRGHEAPQLLEFPEGERLSIGGRPQYAVLTRGDDEEVGHRLERRRELLRQGWLLPCAPLDDGAARAVHAGQDTGREIRLRGDALVEILERGGAAGEVQHDGERGERERQRRRVPRGQSPADRVHLTLSPRSRRHGRYGSVSARGRRRFSCGAG